MLPVMGERRSKNVTLRDVARRAGVSAMTVSRALSDKSGLVSPDTARRCREIAEDMGYVPNLMARSLRGEQLHTIVMFAEFISAHHYLAELVDVVTRSVEARKFGIISCQSLSSFNKALRNFTLSGAVVIAPPEEFYREPFGNMPIAPEVRQSTVLIHSAFDQNLFHEVSPDIAGFSYIAAAHLLELGHSRLGYLGGPRIEDEPNWFNCRREGIERALAAYGRPAKSMRFQACPDPDLGPAAIQQLLKRAPDTTGVMCINDEVAIAAITGAEKLGYRVPEDLSIIGSNDIKLARFYRPALTTLSIDIRSMVETALDLLFDQMHGLRSDPEHKPIRIRLPASLVIRDSTGSPRKTPV